MDTVAETLSPLLDVSAVALDRLIQKRYDTRYVRLVPLLSEAQLFAIRNAGLRGVGTEPVLARHLPHGQNYRVALVEYDDEIGWRVEHGFPEQSAALAEAFDPEPWGEKVTRCRCRIERLGELRVRGGFVPVAELPALLRVEDGLVAEAVKQLVEDSSGLKVATVRGQKLLKRERLPTEGVGGSGGHEG